MKVFRKKDGGIVQLVGKEKMKEWPIELPLIFIEYVRTNQLNTYNDSKLKKDIEQYYGKKKKLFLLFASFTKGSNSIDLTESNSLKWVMIRFSSSPSARA